MTKKFAYNAIALALISVFQQEIVPLIQGAPQMLRVKTSHTMASEFQPLEIMLLVMKAPKQ